MNDFVDGILKEINEKWIDKDKLKRLSNIFIEYGIIEDESKSIPIIIKDQEGNTKTVEMSVKDIFLNIENGSPLSGVGGKNILDRVQFKVSNDNDLNLLLGDIFLDLIEKDISENEIKSRLENYLINNLQKHINNSINEAFQSVAGAILLGKKNNDEYYYNMKKIKKYLKSSIKSK